MRRTTNSQWIFAQDGKRLAGLALGADACAEHENGIAGLKRAFGLDSGRDGLERRRIRAVPEGIRLLERDGLSALVHTAYVFQKAEQIVASTELTRFGKDPIVCAWDEDSFAVVAYEPEDRERVRQLHKAFLAQEIALWTAGGSLILGPGLVLVLTSEVAPEAAQRVLDADLDYKRLVQAATETGIEAELRKADKHWYALSPRWANRGPVKDTEYPVVFWLNPFDQAIYNWGWFTVETLKLWAQNKGPILKKS